VLPLLCAADIAAVSYYHIDTAAWVFLVINFFKPPFVVFSLTVIGAVVMLLSR
jgi:hypothetical protein